MDTIILSGHVHSVLPALYHRCTVLCAFFFIYNGIPHALHYMGHTLQVRMVCTLQLQYDASRHSADVQQKLYVVIFHGMRKDQCYMLNTVHNSIAIDRRFLNPFRFKFLFLANGKFCCSVFHLPETRLFAPEVGTITQPFPLIHLFGSFP